VNRSENEPESFNGNSMASDGSRGFFEVPLKPYLASGP